MSRLALMIVPAALLAAAAAGDWPQYMHDAAHTGDAAGEAVATPLGLLARIRLDDAVMTSPAVVGGRAYVVDQMGSAYCVDPAAGRVVWKASPDGPRAQGSNTSSPCVAGGRVCYGTTAGRLHILSAKDGSVVKTLDVRSPIPGAVTFANGSLYFQTLDAVLYCADLDGRVRWTWDHYKRYSKPIAEKLKTYHPRSYDRPHFGGGDVAVAGKRIVTAFGWDQVCLEDAGETAKLPWCNRAALGKDAGIPMSAAIADGWVVTAWPGVDGAGSVARFKLADGTHAKADARSGQWAVFGTPAVRGAKAYWCRHIRGAAAHEFGKGGLWENFVWSKPAGFTPSVASPALSAGHIAYTTVRGELIVRSLDPKKTRGHRFAVPDGRFISSSPAISGGRVYFGCDDGFLYVLGPGGKGEMKPEKSSLHKPRSKVTPATGKRYAWPSPYGSPANLNYADDPKLRPPFRLRWAVRSFGAFKQPVSAGDEDVVYVTLAGTVVCLEQQTGRTRWRVRLPRQRWARAGVLHAGDRVYVARPSPWLKSGEHRNGLFCLDASTGKTLWAAGIGKRGGSRSAPMLHKGIVTFGSITADGPVVQAWDADSGEPKWTVKLEASAKTAGPSGCGGGGVLYFSTGAGKWQWKEPENVRGRTVAIDAATGRVKWTSKTAFVDGSGTPSLAGDKLYLPCEGRVICVSTKDGSELWRKRMGSHVFHSPSRAADFMTTRGYSGYARRYDLTAAGPVDPPKRILLGGPEHACGPVVLTSSGLSLAVTVGGLYVRDVASGELLWLSRGFAPRTCSNVSVANGRVFCNPQTNNMLYCFEPVSAKD